MVGKYIKKHMDDKGIKQVFVSKQTGISPQVLGTILNDTRKCEVSEYFKICMAAGVDPIAPAMEAGIWKKEENEKISII